VVVEGHETKVQVDLLAGEYGGTGKSRRHQRIQDVTPRKARGCDLAFEMNCEIRIEGILPGGGKDSVTVRVAGIVPFIVMKAMALADRVKEKDAWDICFCVTHFPGGLDALADAFRPRLSNRLVDEGLNKIKEKFASPEHVGPTWVANFEEIDDAEARSYRKRDAYERVAALLARLGRLPLGRISGCRASCIGRRKRSILYRCRGFEERCSLYAHLAFFFGVAAFEPGARIGHCSDAVRADLR
jgi:hypothetical protein